MHTLCIWLTAIFGILAAVSAAGIQMYNKKITAAKEALVKVTISDPTTPVTPTSQGIGNIQQDGNKGTILTEVIMGNKIINETKPAMHRSEPKKEIEKAIPPVTITDNHGNLSIGNSGTVNQTIYNTPPKPLPRQLTNDDLELIKRTIPISFPVEFSYIIGEESAKYAEEVANAMVAMGYKLNISAIGVLINMRPQDVRLDVYTEPSMSTGYVIIYKQ